MVRCIALALFSIAACGKAREESSSPAGAGAGDKEGGRATGITAAHNRVRAEVGVPALVWSEEVAAVAQQWAEYLASRDCVLEHRPDGDYGENLYWSSARTDAATAVSEWADEERHYRARTGKCRGGVCGHYTQIVWRDTTHVGCGVASCGEGEVWVCNYDPAGNMVGTPAY